MTCLSIISLIIVKICVDGVKPLVYFFGFLLERCRQPPLLVECQEGGSVQLGMAKSNERCGDCGIIDRRDGAAAIVHRVVEGF